MASLFPWRGLNVGDPSHPCSKASGGDCCEYLGQLLLNSFGTAIGVIILVNALFLLYSKMKHTAASCNYKMQQIKTKSYRDVVNPYSPVTTCNERRGFMSVLSWIKSYLLAVCWALVGGRACKPEPENRRAKKHAEGNLKYRRAKEDDCCPDTGCYHRAVPAEANDCSPLGPDQGAESRSQSRSLSPQYPVKSEHQGSHQSCSSHCPTSECRSKVNFRGEGPASPHLRHQAHPDPFRPGPGLDRPEQPFSNPAAPQSQGPGGQDTCPLDYLPPSVPHTSSPMSSFTGSFSSSCATHPVEQLAPGLDRTPPLPPPPNYSPECARSLGSSSRERAPQPASARPRSSRSLSHSHSTSFASDDESSFSSSSPRCCPGPEPGTPAAVGGSAGGAYCGPYYVQEDVSEGALQTLARGPCGPGEAGCLPPGALGPPGGAGAYCNPYYTQEAISESALQALMRVPKALEGVPPPLLLQQQQQHYGNTSPRQFPVYQDCPAGAPAHHLNTSPMRQPWAACAPPPAAAAGPHSPIRICSTRHLRPAPEPQCPTRGEAEAPLGLPPCHPPQPLPRRLSYPRLAAGGGSSSGLQCPGQPAYQAQPQPQAQAPRGGRADSGPAAAREQSKARMVVRYSGSAAEGADPTLPTPAAHPLHPTKGQAGSPLSPSSCFRSGRPPPHYDRH